MEIGFLEVSAIFYLLAAIGFTMEAFRPAMGVRHSGPVLLGLGFATHTVAVCLRSLEVGTVPATSFPEGLSFFAWLIVGCFLLIQLRGRLHVVGAVISPLVFAMTLGTTLLYTGDRPSPELLHNPWLPVHVTLAFLGNAVFGLAFAVSVIYLVQESMLKSHRKGAVTLRLPSLEQLDRLNYRCLAWGFPLLTLGILTGGIFALNTWGQFWSWEPREVLSLITWVLYAGLLQFRLTAGLRGKRAATLTILGFGLLVISYLSVNILPLPGRHGGALGS